MLHHAFDGVVERVAHKRAHIHFADAAEQGAVRHAGQFNVVLCTAQCLARQDGVKHCITGFVLRFVLFDALLDVIQVHFAFSRIGFVAQYRNLMFEIMIFAVDDGDVFLRLLILQVLRLQNVADGAELTHGMLLAELDMVGIQKRHSSETHQRTDVEHFRSYCASERRCRRNVAQVAQRECGDGYDHRCGKLTHGDVQRSDAHVGVFQIP